MIRGVIGNEVPSLNTSAGNQNQAEAPKKKVKKTSVPVSELMYGGMATADLQKAAEKEFEMTLQDRIMEETKDKKNVVEAYVYDMRNKLDDKYYEFVTYSEKEHFIAKLREIENWLSQGDPIEERYKEHMERGHVINQLVYCINSYREATMSDGPKFDHIDLAEKQKVLSECVEAEAWLREKMQHHDSLPKYATPVLLTADIRRKTEVLDRFCRSVMTKSMPVKPTAPETPLLGPSQGGDSQSQGADNPSSSPNQNSGVTESTKSGN